MKNAILAILVLIIGVLMTGCRTQNLAAHSRLAADTAAFARHAAYEYTIKKDDKINLSIWDHDDMSVGSVYGIYNSNEVYGKWLLVDVNGNITIPKIGEVHVSGKTVVETEQMLREVYKKWLVNPIIEVKVLNKQIIMLGELKTPGKYVVEKDNMNLLEAIGMAGDFDFYANKRAVTVIRDVNGVSKLIKVDLTRADALYSQNLQLHPGDVVYVPGRRGKSWDKRSGSIIVPIATLVSSAVLINSLVK